MSSSSGSRPIDFDALRKARKSRGSHGKGRLSTARNARTLDAESQSQRFHTSFDQLKKQRHRPVSIVTERLVGKQLLAEGELIKQGLGAAERKAIEDLKSGMHFSGYSGISIPEETEDPTTWADDAGNVSDGDDEASDVEAYLDAVSSLSYSRRKRTTRHRRINENANWIKIKESCLMPFLSWRDQRDEIRNQQPVQMDIDPPAGTYSGTFEAISLFDWEIARSFCITQPSNGLSLVNASLIKHGYIGTSSIRPSVAVSLDLLTVYHAVAVNCPSMSVERFTKTLCYLHRRPYKRYLRYQISAAYDFFLDLQRTAEKCVASALGQDQENWRLLHACPCCNNKMDDEPPVKFQHMVILDGNNSQKRCVGANADLRRFKSEYFIADEDVDQFSKKVVAKATIPSSDDDDDDEDEDTVRQSEVKQPAPMVLNVDEGPEGDPATITPCAEKWKAAQADNHRGVVIKYDQTGIFSSVCRHGLIVLVTDMRQSGELSKYPLSILQRLLEVYNDGLLVAYDIACRFKITAANSSLAETLQKANVTWIVPAFHAWPHNRLCQTVHHPLYMQGVGLEDFETQERLYSFTNQCAGVTRHSSQYHREQVLHMQFQRNDREKYASLATFLYNNHRQAINIITENSDQLHALESLHEVSRTNFIAYLDEEREYLGRLKEAPKALTVRIRYGQALELYYAYQKKLRGIRNRLAARRTRPRPLDAPLTKLERKAIPLESKMEKALVVVVDLETHLGISDRWLEGSDEYKAVFKDVIDRKLINAIDNVERLMVQRLMEQDKLRVGSLCYKLRTGIMVGLERRSTALKNAIATFNREAKLVGIPMLDYKQVLSMEFLAELEFLRLRGTDIRERKWALPGVRTAMNLHFKMMRAREEIVQVAIESRRLQDWITTQAIHRAQVIERLRQAGDYLLGETIRRCEYLERVDEVLQRQLDLLQREERFGEGAVFVDIPDTEERNALMRDMMDSENVGVVVPSDGDDAGFEAASDGDVEDETCEGLDAVEASFAHLVL